MFSLRNKTILITGGSGSWGQEITRQLLAKFNPKEIRIYSRGELKQVEMRRKFQNPKLKFIVGDVRDYDRLEQATIGAGCVFHLSALKHVPVCEENPWETVQTNIIGTHNLVKAANKNHVQKVIDISSDKAVDPFSLYGATKACGERLTIAAQNTSEKTSFVCIRSGNVLGTSGSVVPLFKEQIQRTNEITITDKRMSRFFIRLPDNIALVIKLSQESIGGETLVTKMPAVKIVDLAEVMIQRFGNKKTKIKFIGIRPGEKLYEVLVSRYETPRTFVLGDSYLIKPIFPTDHLEKQLKVMKAKHVAFEEYSSSNARQLNLKEIDTLLKADGWYDDKMHHDSMDYLKKIDKTVLANFFKTEGWLRQE